MAKLTEAQYKEKYEKEKMTWSYWAKERISQTKKELSGNYLQNFIYKINLNQLFIKLL